MKKLIFTIFIASIIIFILISFNCNPFNYEKKLDSNLNILDESNSTRLVLSSMLVIEGSTFDANGDSIDGSRLDTDEPGPMIKVINGTLKNAILDPLTAGGMSVYGNSSIQNVSFANPFTAYMHPITFFRVAAGGTITVSDTNITGTLSIDNIYNVNDVCTITFKNITANNITKLVRQNGGKTWKMTAYFDGLNLTGVKESIFRSDSTTTTVYWRNITCDLAQSSWWYGNFIVNTY